MRSPAREPAQLDVRAALKEGLSRLREESVPSHTLAAELLLMHVLGRERAWLYAHPEEAVEPAQVAHYFELVARRISGVPTQYLTGRQEFWGLDFEVTPDVLIPRPETEHVIEVALARLGQRRSREPLRVADVGTGSGCIAVALARELPEAQIFATDISPAALAVACRNAVRHGVSGRITFLECSLLDAILQDTGVTTRGARVTSDESQVTTHESPLTNQESQLTNHDSHPFDLIASNPPYVGRREAESLPREVCEHEPGEALFAGDTGGEIYAPLIAQAEKLLARGGILVLELGYNSLDHVDTLVDAARGWTRVSVTQDLAGIPRVLAAERA